MTNTFQEGTFVKITQTDSCTQGMDHIIGKTGMFLADYDGVCFLLMFYDKIPVKIWCETSSIVPLFEEYA